MARRRLRRFSSFSSENSSGIAAAQEHVAHAGVLADVFDLAVKLRMEIVAGGVADQARAGAITAIGRAAVGHQEQHAVRVAMHQSRHGRMGVFAARVAHFPRRGVGFLQARNDLPADGAILVGGVNEVEEIGRDGQGQFGVGQHRAGVFLRREGGHQALQLLQGGDAVFELPAPVVPVGFGDIGPKAAAGGMEFFEGIQAGEVEIFSPVARKVMHLHVTRPWRGLWNGGCPAAGPAAVPPRLRRSRCCRT